MDLDLLHSFVSVVDAGGFTRAGERVHRTQSTVSQQIRKLEAALGCELFVREGRQVRLTEDGERLLGYARRMLALSTEIREAVSGTRGVEMVRVGVPDDFAVERMTALVAGFSRAHPAVRVTMRCDLSAMLSRSLERGELDLALFKREPGAGDCLAAWPERLTWLGSRDWPMHALPDPVPLVTFPQGCLYRNRAVHALESAGRRWRIAYESPHMGGIQAALEGGLGVSLMDRRCLTPAMRAYDELLPRAAPSELALCLSPAASSAARGLARRMRDFCDEVVSLTRAADATTPRPAAADDIRQEKGKAAA
ncbi:LysR family transcriptional regulator [Bordetella ansorpii]|uniref:LysR family transcriptional regulator n=1 Tax=Bordetella ansorpii TaxID=288768 RepID=A0A157S7R5_9BORD|nr:LysR substrate-binding domain-containing protein [Bordetella ansorpii]SAI66468.1 LysR family transcriptional regulator [Bordetella ansorpii]